MSLHKHMQKGPGDFAAIRSGAASPDVSQSGVRPGAFAFTAGQTNYAARLRSFFVAPVAGDSTFFASTDDSGALYLARADAAAQGGWAYAPDPVATVPCWTSWNQWDKYPSQASAPVSSSAGEAVLLDLVYQQGGGGDLGQVGVRMPSAEAVANSQPNVHQVAVSADYFGAKLTIVVTGTSLAGNVCVVNEGINMFVAAQFDVAASTSDMAAAIKTWSGVNVVK